MRDTANDVIPSTIRPVRRAAAGLLLGLVPCSGDAGAQDDPFPSIALTGPIPLIDAADRPPPGSMVAWGGRLFFSRDSSYGRELWVSDGTPGSERLVRDIVPGRRGSNPFATVSTESGVLFIADSSTGFPAGDPGSGREVWFTDGTTDGTRELVDVVEGAGDGAGGLTVSLPSADRAFFTAIGPGVPSQGAGRVNRIYRTDGTPAGTELFFDAGSLPGRKRVLRMLARDDRLWFSVTDSDTGDGEFWTSDGDAPPVRAATAPSEAVAFSTTAQGLLGIGPGGWALLTLNDAEHGAEPWRLDPDGTLGLIADLNPGPDSSGARGDVVEVADGRVIFQAGPHLGWGGGVFATDGTAAGTTILTDQFSVTGNSFPLIAGNRDIAFMIGFGIDFGFEIVRTDGTPEGTFLVRDIVPGRNADTASLPLELRMVGDRAFFLGGDRRLWTSDGTEAGTQPIPGSPEFPPAIPAASASAAGGGFYYITHLDEDGVRGIWRSDGTEAGTSRIVGGAPSPDLWLGDQPMAMVGDVIYFVGSDTELWRSDGTPDGTFGLGFEPGPALQAVEIVAAGPVGVIAAGFDAEAFRLRLFRSDGTIQGTAPFADLGDFASVDVRDFAWAGNRLHFALNDDAGSRWEPWVSDVTGPGTRLLADLNPGEPGSFPRGAFAFGGRVFFAADDGTHGVELWYSEGDSPPALLADLAPGDLHPREFVVLDGRFLFSGVGGPGTRRILWVSDGTPEGTRPVPCSADEPRGLTLFQNRVIFSAWDGGSGRELWISDGTEEGTRLVADIFPGQGASRSSDPDQFTVADERVFFAATDGEHGRELWVSDGTDGGSRMVADLMPGPAGAEPGPITAAAGRVAFIALGPDLGRELWVSDGTARGTVMAEDFVPGPLDGAVGRVGATSKGVFWFGRAPEDSRHRLRFTPLPPP